jgi:hypothetical protein
MPSFVRQCRTTGPVAGQACRSTPVGLVACPPQVCVGAESLALTLVLGIYLPLSEDYASVASSFQLP